MSYYEITFIESGKTVEVDRDEAIELLGQDDFDLANKGHLPHIVCYEHIDPEEYDEPEPDEAQEWHDFDPDC